MKRLLGRIAPPFLALALVGGAATQAQTPTLTVLHSFGGSPSDGAFSVAPLIMDAAGNFYGTTAAGGNSNCSAMGSVGCGTVYKLDPAGNETVLYKFSGPDGAFPAGGLLRDAAGNLYGTTVNGGGAGPCNNFGCGTVFKLGPVGNETVLHAFTGGTDGGNPTAGLISDSAGNLYGTTGFGGNSTTVCSFGCGTVFKVDSAGNATPLLSFSGADGIEPSAPLIMDSAGNLYGTTFRGGSGGVGTVFKLDSTGNVTLLHAFTGSSDGGGLGAGLILDAAGNLYGTTEAGAAGFGTVFKIDPVDNLTVLHTFTGGSDGGNVAVEGVPAAGLIMDAAGNLYGTTEVGGAGFGIVFKLHTPGNFSVLHTFTSSDGSLSFAPLIMDTSGDFFGTTSASGAFGHGTVFKLKLAAAAIHVFVDIKPQSCPNPINVGASGVLPVAILGTSSFDVTTIDPLTVKLQGVSPLRSALEDVATPFTGALTDATSCTTVGPDGFADLVLQFSSPAISTALGAVTNGQVLLLTLTGNLKTQFGGTPITGQDIVVIER